MRTSVAAEALAALDDAQAVELIARTIHGGATHDHAEGLLLDAFATVIATPSLLASERLAQLYSLAVERRCDDVARFLFPRGPKLTAQPTALPFDPLLQDLTLGYKKTFARTAGPDDIARLLHDPAPTVIENLLKNPRVREQDVVRLAARRPNLESVLQVIFRSRFCRLSMVQRALVKNPFTPAELAVKLVPNLLESDLRQVVADPGLAQEVCDAARDVLARRRPA